MLSPAQFAQRFEEKSALPHGTRLAGVCGRFTRGTRPEHFERLSDEPGKRLSWVCSAQSLGSILGKSAVEAMLAIGKRLEWLRARLDDGTEHQLLVFPETIGTVATWRNLWRLIREHFGAEVDAALEPFKAEIEALETSDGYASFDPDGTLLRVSELAVREKHADPRFLTVERFLAAHPCTLYHARGFLDHTVGCNPNFLGTGVTPHGMAEMLVPNMWAESMAALPARSGLTPTARQAAGRGGRALPDLAARHEGRGGVRTPRAARRVTPDPRRTRC